MGWENFFLGQVGASAALGGLLFVAVSLNLTRILSFASLPDRALVALSLILAILVLSSMMLIPGQAPAIIGIEALVVGLALAALALRTNRPTKEQGKMEARTQSGANLAMLAIAVVPYVIGGVIILAGGLTAGLYWIAAAIILSFIKAVLDAWVLLVEINR